MGNLRNGLNAMRLRDGLSTLNGMEIDQFFSYWAGTGFSSLLIQK